MPPSLDPASRRSFAETRLGRAGPPGGTRGGSYPRPVPRALSKGAALMTPTMENDP